MIMLIVFDWCIQHVQCAQNGVFIVSPACVIHKCVITAQIIYGLEKTIYGLKKTIYGTIYGLKKTIYSFDQVSSE